MKKKTKDVRESTSCLGSFRIREALEEELLKLIAKRIPRVVWGRGAVGIQKERLTWAKETA